ncbi:MAG TPA: hypothetical protein VJK51_03500 [Candidatus Nanoarchaeia archaeon]|nr:hypothetical protein [Candidatus Nanoarchaeia archaeon]
MLRRKKYPNEIIDYLKKNLKKGYTKESLRWALVNQDYSRLEVDKALQEIDQILGKEAPLLKAKPVIKYESYPLNEKPSLFKRLFRT